MGYVADYSTPAWLIRYADQTRTLTVKANGALTAPISGTYTLQKPDGSFLINAQPITVASSIATYAIAANVLPTTLDVGEGWLEIWSLTFTGLTQSFRRDAAIVIAVLEPSMADDGPLIAAHSDLNQVLLTSGATSFQVQRDEAWNRILIRLLSEGIYPYRIVSKWSLHSVHVYMTLHIIFLDGSTYMPGSGYDRLADKYANMYEKEWLRLKAKYDANGDGIPDASDKVTFTPAVGNWVSTRYR